jgi:stress response protein YsnF
MLIEEVHIRRRSAVERREIPSTIRSEQVRIEREGVAEGVQPTARPATDGPA